MKYRRLTLEELAELEKEFVNFLSVNSITGPDWVKIKEKDPVKAEEHIATFSDMVFEKILEGVKYLDLKTPKDYKAFKCLPDKMILLGIQVDGNTAVDFTKNTPSGQMINQLLNSGANLQMYRAEKTYFKERNKELFEMMEKGCLISKGEMYKLLKSLDKK